MAAGIRTRHGRSCRSRDGGRCNCNTGRMRRGSTRSGTTRRSARRSSRWPRRRAGALTLRVGPRAHSPGAVQGHAHRRGRRRLKGAKAGTIRTRSGDAYKPSAIRSYEAALRLRVLPELGGARVSDVSRVDLQEFIEGIKAKGLNASTVQTTLMPVRAIYRRAIAKGQVAVNPTTALEVPAIRGKRDRNASPAEAARLLAALPERDRHRAEDREGATHRPDRLRPARPHRRAADQDRRPRGARLRTRLTTIRAVASTYARGEGVARGRTRAHHPARVPPHVRLADDRGRGEREDPLDVHGPRQHQHHARPLRAPDAGE